MHFKAVLNFITKFKSTPNITVYLNSEYRINQVPRWFQSVMWRHSHILLSLRLNFPWERVSCLQPPRTDTSYQKYVLNNSNLRPKAPSPMLALYLTRRHVIHFYVREGIAGSFACVNCVTRLWKNLGNILKVYIFFLSPIA